VYIIVYGIAWELYDGWARRHSPTQLEDESSTAPLRLCAANSWPSWMAFAERRKTLPDYRKHGQPQAVLMSFETYRLLRGAKAQPLPAQSDDALS